MASPPDGRPLNESPEASWHNSVHLIACTVAGNTAHGIMLTLYAICAHNLWTRTTNENRRKNTLFLWYITIMAILGTLYVISNSWIVDTAYIKHRLYSDGPFAYFLLNFSKPYTVLGSVCFVLISFMADGLILWRFMILYRDVRLFYLIAVVPCLTYILSICFGLLTLIQSSLSGSSLRAARVINYTLIYSSLSVSLTCIVTVAMLGKLYYHRCIAQRILGKNYRHEYTGIAAILVESAALSALSCLLFIILYGINNAMQWVALTVLAQVQIIAPLLIIFRVSKGQAWSRNTHSMIVSSLPISQPSGGNATLATFQDDHEAPTMRSNSQYYIRPSNPSGDEPPSGQINVI